MLLSRLLGRRSTLALARIPSLSSPSTLSVSSFRDSPIRYASTSSTTNSEPSIIIEDSCLQRLKDIVEKPNEEFLRVDVETGGCSGFSYKFDIESKDSLDPDEDLVFERDSYKIVVNKQILPYMKGSTIEYNESLIKSSFQVKNPVAETKCGCGTSFSIDLNKISPTQS